MPLLPAVQDLFQKMCDCAALNPDSDQDGECCDILGCLQSCAVALWSGTAPWDAPAAPGSPKSQKLPALDHLCCWLLAVPPACPYPQHCLACVHWQSSCTSAVQMPCCQEVCALEAPCLVLAAYSTQVLSVLETLCCHACLPPDCQPPSDAELEGEGDFYYNEDEVMAGVNGDDRSAMLQHLDGLLTEPGEVRCGLSSANSTTCQTANLVQNGAGYLVPGHCLCGMMAWPAQHGMALVQHDLCEAH